MIRITKDEIAFLESYLRKPEKQGYYFYQNQKEKLWIPTVSQESNVFDMYPYYGLKEDEELLNCYIYACSYKKYGGKKQEDVLEARFLQITLKYEFRDEEEKLVCRDEVVNQLINKVLNKCKIPIPTYMSAARYIYLIYEFDEPLLYEKKLVSDINKIGGWICEIINDANSLFRATTKGVNDRILLPGSWHLKHRSRFDAESFKEYVQMVRSGEKISLEGLLSFYKKKEKAIKPEVKSYEAQFLDKIFYKKPKEDYFQLKGKRERFCKCIEMEDSMKISMAYYKSEENTIREYPGFMITIDARKELTNQAKIKLLLSEEPEKPAYILEKGNQLQFMYLLEEAVRFEDKAGYLLLTLKKKRLEQTIGHILNDNQIPYEFLYTNLAEQFLEIEVGKLSGQIFFANLDNLGNPCYLPIEEKRRDLYKKEIDIPKEEIWTLSDAYEVHEEERLFAELVNTASEELEEEEVIEEKSPEYSLTKLVVAESGKLRSRDEGISKRRIHQIINLLYAYDFDVREWEAKRILFLFVNYCSQIVNQFEMAVYWTRKVNASFKQPLQLEVLNRWIDKYRRCYQEKGAYLFRRDSFIKVLGLEGEEELQTKIGIGICLRDLRRKEQKMLSNYVKAMEAYELMNVMKKHPHLTYAEIATLFGKSERWVKKKLNLIGYKKGMDMELFLQKPKELPITTSEIFNEKEIVYGMEL